MTATLARPPRAISPGRTKSASLGRGGSCDSTTAGDLVQTLHETLDKGSSSVIEWDMLTRSQQRIVSGIYIYSVESRYGTKVDKFAVIR